MGKSEVSRIGKMPVKLPEGVKIEIDGKRLNVKGPKGQLSYNLPPGIELKIIDTPQKEIQVINKESRKKGIAFHGLARTLINNMVQGVVNGFEKKLEIVGVGYRASLQKNKELVLSLGYSHPVVYRIPEGIDVEVDEKQTVITVKGIDKQQVGEVAAKIRGFRPPEPYKGKGIRYLGEIVHQKAGKARG
ncbi:MAG: 50S ribosomal protein L6 [Deltaproteobacteria bacterium]|nr:50S ribosomal protein L6 [Deltaproteobacteria bacterium]RLA91484.1 MAG: 50S ribosomal protein L6 [Deltaproteobacteria bacterium]